eukprot:gene32283-16849_t
MGPAKPTSAIPATKNDRLAVKHYSQLTGTPSLHTLDNRKKHGELVADFDMHVAEGVAGGVADGVAECGAGEYIAADGTLLRSYVDKDNHGHLHENGPKTSNEVYGHPSISAELKGATEARLYGHPSISAELKGAKEADIARTRYKDLGINVVPGSANVKLVGGRW